jgi:protein-S-isoprenylcysteine O-methyltransferase Ste14
VARGLYRVIRNPMYTGVLLVIFGQALLFASLATCS